MSETMTQTTQIIYPESDGKPMGETDKHRDCILGLIHALQVFFRDDPDVYVSGDLFVYYEEGKPSECCCPDVFVVRGVHNRSRRTYKIWEEGKGPDFVIEVTSLSTRQEDRGNKKVKYAELGVREYFIYDPLNEYLKPPLVGYRLEGDDYVPLELSQGRLVSEVTGLELGIHEGMLRLFEPASGEWLRTPFGSEIGRLEAEAERKRAEEQNRQQAEEIRRLKAELARRSGAHSAADESG